VTACPDCGKTAIEKKDLPGHFHCRYCNKVFEKVKDVEKVPKDGKETAFQKCKVKTAAQIQQRHPNWSTAQVDEMAEASCMHHLDTKEDDVNVEDGEKVESCVKQVTADLKKKHPDLSDKDIAASAWAICNASLKGK
jgi:hypothetical protein